MANRLQKVSHAPVPYPDGGGIKANQTVTQADVDAAKLELIKAQAKYDDLAHRLKIVQRGQKAQKSGKK